MYQKTYQTQVKLTGKTRNKYGAVRTFGFDSKKEYLRSEELRYLALGNEVSDVQSQVPIDLYGVNGTKICTYRADFVYLEKDGTKVIEDVKSHITCTPVFKMKWSLLEDMYKYEISRGEVKLVINLSR